MKTLKIKKSKWYRGEPNGSNLLRSEDGTMCCLGFYLRSCGLKSIDIKDISVPLDINTIIPEQAKWLLDKSGTFNSKDCGILMSINDKRKIGDKRRMERITKKFAKHNIKVVFVD